MGRRKLPEKVEGQKKLDDFEDRVEKVDLPCESPLPSPESRTKKMGKGTPKTRKALVEEQRQRPEVMQAVKDAEEKVLEGIEEEKATGLLVTRLIELGVPHDLICTLIVKEQDRSSVWKLDSREVYRSLSLNYKHRGKVDAGRKGGKASAEAKKKKPMSSSTAGPVNHDDVLAAPPAPALPTSPENEIPIQGPSDKLLSQPAPIAAPPIADIDVSKPEPAEPDDLVNNPSPNEPNSPPAEEDYPKLPVASYLLDVKSGAVFRTAASAAL